MVLESADLFGLNFRIKKEDALIHARLAPPVASRPSGDGPAVAHGSPADVGVEVIADDRRPIPSGRSVAHVAVTEVSSAPADLPVSPPRLEPTPQQATRAPMVRDTSKLPIEVGEPSRPQVSELEDAVRRAEEAVEGASVPQPDREQARDAAVRALSEAVRPPWYFNPEHTAGHGALGELSVTQVRPLTDDRIEVVIEPVVGQRMTPSDIELTTPSRGGRGVSKAIVLPPTDQRAVLDAVRTQLTGMLAQQPGQSGEALAEKWESLLFEGVTFAVGRRLVWIKPELHEPQPRPSGDGPRRFGVSFASTSSGVEGSRARDEDAGLGLEGLFRLTNAYASAILGDVGLSYDGETDRKTASERMVVWGRKQFVTQTREFRAGLRIEVFVDGRPWDRVIVEDDVLTVSLPGRYTDLQGKSPDKSAPRRRPDDGAASVPSRARQVLNAVSVTRAVLGWHRALVASSLDAAEVAAVAGQAVRQLLNERTMRNRAAWVLADGDMIDSLGSVRAGSSAMHLTVGTVLRELEFVDVTPDVGIRDDLAVTAAGGVESSGSSGFGVAVSPDALRFNPRLNLPAFEQGRSVMTTYLVGGAVSGGYRRHTSFTIGTKAQNHTVLNTEGDQARYRAVYDLTITTRGAVVAPVNVRVTAEVAVPVTEAAEFETSMFGQPFSAVTTGMAGTPRVRVPRPAVVAAAHVGEDGFTQSRTGFVPVEGEPVVLAARRGLGFGQATRLAGSEQVQAAILKWLGQFAPAGEVPASVRRTVLNHVSSVAMEADFGRVISGRGFTVDLGGTAYRVVVQAELGAHRAGPSRHEMRVNTRVVSGTTISGERGGAYQLGGQVDGELVFEVHDGSGDPENAFRFGFPGGGLQGSYRNSSGHGFSQTVGGYRRTETRGDVVEHEYDVAYRVKIWAVTGQPADEFMINSEVHGTSAQIVVPLQHATQPNGLRTPTAAEVDNVKDRAEGTALLAGWPAADRLTLERDGTSGMYAVFRHIPQLQQAAAGLVAAADGLPATDTANLLTWSDSVFDISPTELSANFSTMVRGDGWWLSVPGRDGQTRTIVVRAQMHQPDYAYTEKIEFEQYRQFAPKHAIATERARTGALTLEASALWRNLPRLDEGFGDRERRGVLDVSGKWQRKRAAARIAEAGSMEIRRATYGGNNHVYRAGFVFELTMLDSRGHAAGNAVYVVADHAADILVTDRQAEVLGLDRPGGATQPSAASPGRVPVDPQLLKAAAHAELVHADGLRAMIKQQLLQRGVVVDAMVDHALHSRFSDDALENAFTALATSGVWAWLPMRGAFHSTGYLMVRVRADLGESTADRDRADVSFTNRAEETTGLSTTQTAEHNWATDGKIGGRGAPGSNFEFGGGVSKDTGGSSAQTRGQDESTKEIYRVEPKGGHEFNHRLTFHVDMKYSHELPLPLHHASTAARGVVSGINAVGAWARGLPQPVRAWHDLSLPTWAWEHSFRVDGDSKARLVVPRVLTRAAADGAAWTRPGLTEASPAAAQPGDDAPSRAEWRPAAASRPAVNGDLAADPGLHPWTVEPAARFFATWAGVATRGPRLHPDLSQAATATGPDDPAMYVTMHYTSDSMLRSQLPALLRHDYRIGETGIKLGMDIVGIEVYGDGAGLGAVKSRRYKQHEQSPVSSHETSTGTSYSGNLKLSYKRDDGVLRKFTANPSFGAGQTTANSRSSQLSHVNERNSQSSRKFRLYRLDVIATVHGPEGAISGHVPKAVLVWSDIDVGRLVGGLPPVPPAPQPAPRPTDADALHPTRQMPGDFPVTSPLLPTHFPTQTPTESG